ncbi:MAG TPA: hypothetical protein VF648_10535 [Pyrinomonadaceae bacterium]|jgi:rubrerythrin
MAFFKFISDYLRKREAEKEARGKSIRSVIVLLFASIGTLVGTSLIINLPTLGVSLAATLLLTPLIIPIFVYLGILSAKMYVYPLIQGVLVEADDNFNYKLYLECDLEDKLEQIRKANVSAQTKEKWEAEAHERFFEELENHKEQIKATLNQVRNQEKVIHEVSLMRMDLDSAIENLKNLEAKAKKVRSEQEAMIRDHILAENKQENIELQRKLESNENMDTKSLPPASFQPIPQEVTDKRDKKPILRK